MSDQIQQPTSAGLARPNNGAQALPAGMRAHQDGMGGQTLTAQAETASEFLAAQARALVEARYARAVSRPRDLDQVRVRLTKMCVRPAFAEIALYSKPIYGGGDRDEDEKNAGGGGIEGLSIRFAEEAIREMGNISVDSFTIYDDARRRIVRVVVEDLERAASYSRDITIEKTVERKFVQPGATIVGKRVNSYGKILYIIPATDEQILNKENAIVSKTLRSLGLRLIPADIKGECQGLIYDTLESGIKEDPTAARKKIIDSFAALNVMPAQLAEFLGHPVDGCVEKELVELRGLYQAIRDGEATWAEAVEARLAARANKPAPAGASATVVAPKPDPAGGVVVVDVKPESIAITTPAGGSGGVSSKPAAPTVADLTNKLKAEGKKAPGKKAPPGTLHAVDETGATLARGEREPGDDDVPIK